MFCIVHLSDKRPVNRFQFRLRTVFILVALIGIALVVWRIYMPPAPPKLLAECPHELQLAYRELFQSVGPQGLTALTGHRDDSIAVQAAWEEVRLTVPLEPEAPASLDRRKLESFLGLLEARTRVPPPQWWANAVLDAQAECRDGIFFSRLRNDRWKYQRRTTQYYENGRVHLGVGEDSVVIREQSLEGVSRCILSALVTSKRCYVATQCDVGSAFHLTCINRASGEMLWRSHVWVFPRPPLSGMWGFPMHAAIVKQHNRVVVFAGTIGEIHVEGFRAHDGATLFRFSSLY
jgi:hypothetical protein